MVIIMTEKYRVIDGFDFDNNPCKLIEDTKTTEQYNTENELEANSLCKLLNEQEELLNQIKKLCMDNRIPVCLTAHIPKNCEHYHACFENHTENAVSFGESKIANKILKIINGDGGVDD